MKSSGPDNHLSHFLLEEFPQFMDYLNQGNLSKCKEVFNSLAQNSLSWQEIDRVFSEMIKMKIVTAEFESQSEAQPEPEPWPFSADILQNCAVSGDLATFNYLVEEQKIPLDERALSAFATACYFGHASLVQHFLTLPQFNASEEFLMVALRHVEYANQENIKEILMPHIMQSMGLTNNEEQENVKHSFQLIKRKVISSRNISLKTYNTLYDQQLETLHELRPMVATHPKSEILTEVVSELIQLTERSKACFEKYKLGNACDALQADELVQSLLSSFPEVHQVKNENAALGQADTNEDQLVKQLKLLHFIFSKGKDQIEEKLTNISIFEEIQDVDPLFKEIFISYSQLQELIAQGDLKGVLAFLENWKEKGITIQKIDEKFTFLFDVPFMFSNVLLGDIAFFGRREILEQVMNKEDVELDPTAMINAIKGNQGEIVDLVLKTQNLSSDLISMFLGLALTFEKIEIARQLYDAAVIIAKKSSLKVQDNWSELIHSREDMKTLHESACDKVLNVVKEAKEIGRQLLDLLDKMETLSEVKSKTHRLLICLNLKISNTHKLKACESQTFYSDVTEVEMLFLSYYITLSLNHAYLEAKSDEQVAIFKKASLMARSMLLKLMPETAQIASLSALEDMPDQYNMLILRDQGEDAVAPADSEDIGLYQAIKDSYSEKYKELGQEAILADLKQYLKDQFLKANLSEKYDAATAMACYQNIHHSAWRYLLKPNPWILENAQYAKDSAIIWNDHLEMLAYFWLAASDENTPCTDDITLSGRKDHLAAELMVLNREHNNDGKRLNEKTQQLERFDDLKGDNPSCPGGVEKRIYQLLIGHPITDKVKPLTPQIMADKFKEDLMTENDGKGLFDKLAQASFDDLQAMKGAIDDWITNFGEVEKETQEILEKLKVKPDEFLVKQIDHYGKRRLNKASLTFQREKFENYEKFILALSCSPLKYFGEIISQRVNKLLSNQTKPDPLPLLTAYENYKATPETTIDSSTKEVPESEDELKNAFSL